MKYFLASFSICLIVSYLFLFFFGNILIENSWAALLLAAIIALVVLVLVFKQEQKLSKLEKEFNETRENYQIRLKALENSQAKNGKEKEEPQKQ